MIDPQSISAYVLAGGASSRFGSDKARAIVQGQPLIRRVVEQLQPMIPNIKAVARHAGTYDDLGIVTIADLKPGLGPLAGLHAALHDAKAPWVLLVSCDFVDLKLGWLPPLLTAATDTTDAVAYRHGLWEPLLALYARRILPTVESRLTCGKLTMQQLLSSVRTIALPMPPDWPAHAHVNTPDELRASIDSV